MRRVATAFGAANLQRSALPGRDPAITQGGDVWSVSRVDEWLGSLVQFDPGRQALVQQRRARQVEELGRSGVERPLLAPGAG
jgi:hypothetical protein